MEEPEIERPEEDLQCEEARFVLPISTESTETDNNKKDRKKNKFDKKISKPIEKSKHKFSCIYCKKTYPLSH